MTLPAFLFGFLLSTLYGVAFHFWKEDDIKHLFLYLILSWLGFLCGHLLGGAIGWTFAAVGPLNAGMATLGSAIFLFVGRWLSQVQVERE